MISSLKRRSLFKPIRGEKIHAFDLGVVRARNRNKAHSKLLELYNSSDLSKAELAKMLGKRPEQITRWLAGPGNLTIDTISDLIFALNGEHFSIQCEDDLSRGKSNHQPPNWLLSSTSGSKWHTISKIGEYPQVRRKNSHGGNYTIELSSNDPEKDLRYGRYSNTSNKDRATV